VKDLDIIRDVIRVVMLSGVVELGEERLVLIEAVLIGVGDVGVQISIKELGVTVVVEATTAILLCGLAPVLPNTVQITAELRLASTVVTSGGVKAGVKTMNRGVAVEVSDTLVDVVDLQANGGTSRGMLTVGVVGAKGTLQKCTIDTFVLTARDIGLVAAALASATKLGLATVKR